MLAVSAITAQSDSETKMHVQSQTALKLWSINYSIILTQVIETSNATY